MTLDELLEMAERHARHILLERQEPALTPYYHLVTPPEERDAVILASWNNDDEKRMVMTAAAEIARQVGALSALWSGEAWMARYDLPPGAPRRRPPGSPPPSEDPNRIEVVMMVATDGHETKGRFFEMQRGEAGQLVALVNMNQDEKPISFFGRLLDGIIVPPKAKMN